jgi:antitoxin ParD1/3/4
MATMNVSVTKEMVAFVEDQIRSGSYVSASEVMRDGLRLLQQEKAVAHEKLQILRREISVGISDIKSGRISDTSVKDIARSVLERSTRAS